MITVSPIWACDLHAVTSLLYEGKIAEGLYWALKQDREAGEPVGYATYALSFVGEYDESRRLGSVAVPAEEDRLDGETRTILNVLLWRQSYSPMRVA